jgi:hypothetical protein
MRGAVLAAGIASAIAMIWGAAAGRSDVVTAGATLFAVVAVLAAVVTGRQAWNWSSAASRAPLMPAYVALLQTTRLATIAYAWGAVTMQGLYLTPLTGLRWQHGWQYAAVMALLAVASALFSRSMKQPLPGENPAGWERHFRWAMPLAGAQGVVAFIGAASLLVSGKIASVRADWAANRVFLALAVAILAVSLASLIVQRRLQVAGRPR